MITGHTSAKMALVSITWGRSLVKENLFSFFIFLSFLLTFIHSLSHTGYINKESFECGTTDERYLGCAKDTTTNIVEIFDNNDDLAGSLDQGTCIV